MRLDINLTKQIDEIMHSQDFHFLKIKNNYRYERKYTIPKYHSLTATEQIIKRNSFLFKEIFHQRQINNIYFDTEEYNDYFDNVLGVSNRKKIRIRWYGNTFGEIKKPVLEIKIKKGIVGDKWSYPLKSFKLNNHLKNETIQNIFNESSLPLPIREMLKPVFPALLNSYQRKYFLSADQKFRITLDFDLLYYKIDKNLNQCFGFPFEDENHIVELKYGLKDEINVHRISAQFPFSINKNSKYVNGVNKLKHFPQ